MPYKMKYHMIPPDHPCILPHRRLVSTERTGWFESKKIFKECIAYWNGQVGYQYHCTMLDEMFNEKSEYVRDRMPKERKYFGELVHLSTHDGYVQPSLKGV